MAGHSACEAGRWAEAVEHYQAAQQGHGGRQVSSGARGGTASLPVGPVGGDSGRGGGGGGGGGGGIDPSDAIKYEMHALLQDNRPQEALHAGDRLARLAGLRPSECDVSVLMMRADAYLCLDLVDEALALTDKACEALLEHERRIGEVEGGTMVDAAIGRVGGFHVPLAMGGRQCADTDDVGGGTYGTGHGNDHGNAELRRILAQALNNKALLMACHEQRDKACALLNYAIEMDSSAMQPYFNLALLLWESDRKTEAVMVWFEKRDIPFEVTQETQHQLDSQATQLEYQMADTANGATSYDTGGDGSNDNAITSHVMPEHRFVVAMMLLYSHVTLQANYRAQVGCYSSSSIYLYSRGSELTVIYILL